MTESTGPWIPPDQSLFEGLEQDLHFSAVLVEQFKKLDEARGTLSPVEKTMCQDARMTLLESVDGYIEDCKTDTPFRFSTVQQEVARATFVRNIAPYVAKLNNDNGLSLSDEEFVECVEYLLLQREEYDAGIILRAVDIQVLHGIVRPDLEQASIEKKRLSAEVLDLQDLETEQRLRPLIDAILPYPGLVHGTLEARTYTEEARQRRLSDDREHERTMEELVRIIGVLPQLEADEEASAWRYIHVYNEVVQFIDAVDADELYACAATIAVECGVAESSVVALMEFARKRHVEIEQADEAS